MDFSFIDDPRWNNLDSNTKNRYINIAFQKEAQSDPRWTEFSPDKQQRFQDIYTQQAGAYSKSKEPEPDLQIIDPIQEGLKDVVKSTLGFAKMGTDLYEEKVGGKVADIAQTGIDKLRNADILKPDPNYKRSSGWRGYVEDIERMIPQIVSQFGVALTPAGSIGSMGFMGTQIAGGQYEDLKKQDVPTTRAIGASLVNAAVQMPLEALSLSKAMKLWKPTKKALSILREVTESMGTEFLTEWMQQYPEAATNIWAKAKGAPVEDQVNQFIENFWATTKEGMYQGAVAAPFGGMISGAGGILSTQPQTTVDDIGTAKTADEAIKNFEDSVNQDLNKPEPVSDQPVMGESEGLNIGEQLVAKPVSNKLSVEDAKAKIVEEKKSVQTEQKQPWEMTKEEFNTAYKNNKIPKIHSDQILNDLDWWRDHKSDTVKIADVSPLSESTEDSLRFHHVTTALREGKPVPESVLKEYPDLKQGETSKTEKQPWDYLDTSHPDAMAPSGSSFVGGDNLSVDQKVEYHKLWIKRINDTLKSVRNITTDDTGIKWANKNAKAIKSGKIKKLVTQRKNHEKALKWQETLKNRSAKFEKEHTQSLSEDRKKALKSELKLGQSVIWKTKAGKEFSGKLIKQNKKTWTVEKADGKKTFVNPDTQDVKAVELTKLPVFKDKYNSGRTSTKEVNEWADQNIDDKYSSEDTGDKKVFGYYKDQVVFPLKDGRKVFVQWSDNDTTATIKEISTDKIIPFQQNKKYNPHLDSGGNMVDVSQTPDKNEKERTDVKKRQSRTSVRGADEALGNAPATKEYKNLIEFSKSDIDFEFAKQAHNWNSMDPERRAKGHQEGYYQHLKELHDELKNQVKPEQYDLLASELERYKQGYLKKYNNWLGAISRTASSMVTGPSNFPVNRNEKALNAENNRFNELQKFEKKAKRSIEKKLGLRTTAISSDDPQAIQKLKDKLASLEKNHQTMKDANKIARNKKTSDADKIKSLSDLGFTEKNAKNLVESDYLGIRGFASFTLTNNNANIKRVKARVKALERKAGDQTESFKVGDVEIIDNVEDNRVQIVFDEKPNEEIRKKLKSRGFRWSPKNKVWQRQRNTHVVQIAKDIVATPAKFQTALTQETPKGKLSEKERLHALYQTQKRRKAERKPRSVQGQRLYDNLGYQDSNDTTKIVPAFTKGRRQIKKIAKAFGHNAVFFTSKSSKVNLVNGFKVPGINDEIYLNVNSPNPLISVVGHEALHQLKESHPDLYDFLIESIDVTDENFKAYAKTLGEQRKGHFSAVTDEEVIQEELIADFASDQFQDPDFWANMYDKNSTFTQRIINVVQKVIDKIKTLFPRAEQYISNFEDSQDALAYAMSEAMKREEGATDKNGISFQTASIANRWYSALQKAVENVKQKAMPAKMWASLIESKNFKKAGVKQEEVDWSGLKDFLKDRSNTTQINDIPITSGSIHVRFSDDITNDLNRGWSGFMGERGDTPQEAVMTDYGDIKFKKVNDSLYNFYEVDEDGKTGALLGEVRKDKDEWVHLDHDGLAGFSIDVFKNGDTLQNIKDEIKNTPYSSWSFGVSEEYGKIFNYDNPIVLFSGDIGENKNINIILTGADKETIGKLQNKNKKKVTKQEVVDYLKENNVRVEEAVKGNNSIKITEALKKDGVEEISVVSGIDDTAKHAMFKMHNQWLDMDAMEAFYDDEEISYQSFGDAKKIVKQAMINPTKFSQHQLKGGKNYKELLITLPDTRKNFYTFIEEENLQGETSERQMEIYRKKYGGIPVYGDTYKSDHYDEPNILVHIRMSERTVDGKKVLHIEEVQSDWHQEGRKKGYAGNAKKVLSDLKAKYPSLPGDTGQWSIDALKEAGATETESKMWFAALMMGRVPDAPFKKTWPILAMKRMVRYAAENGFDTIAWSGGQIQADRYDLRKQVEMIEVADRLDIDFSKTEPTGKSIDISFKQGGMLTLGFTNDGIVDNSNRAEMKGKHLSDIIGKEISRKILKSKGHEVFHDEDLKVGGEGMKKFYDVMLPNEVNKFFNKKIWGKAKVGEIEIKAGDKGDVTLHALPITPQMKSKALTEGMPLFATKEKTNIDSKEFETWFKDSKVVDENGEPKIVTHGTDEDFNIFKRSALGYHTFGNATNDETRATAAMGFWFNSDGDIETKKTPYNKNIKVYLSIQNPIEFENLESLQTDVSSFLKKDGYDNYDDLSKDVQRWVKKQQDDGHDGIEAYDEEFGGTSYVAFEPNQIKSIYNRGTWSPTNPDIRYQTAEDSFYHKAADMVTGNLKHRKDKGKNYNEDVSTLAHIFKTTMFNAEKIGGAYKRLWNIIRKQDDYKFEAQRELWYEGDLSLLEQFKTFGKKSKFEYQKLKKYLLRKDINRQGFIVRESEDRFNLLHWKKRKVIGTYETKEAAWKDAISIEAQESGLSEQGQEALINFRKMSHNLYHHFARNIEEAIQAYEQAGQPLPQITIQTEDGTTQIDLRAAADKMGDLRGSYFPRLRSTGQWRVIGKKNSVANEIQFFDTRMSANSYRSKLERNGFSTGIEKVGKFSEDLFQSLEPLLAQQQILNKALKDISNTDKERLLEDANIKAKWQGDTFILSGNINDNIETAVAPLGGKLKERWTNRSVRFEIAFEDVSGQNPNDFEQKVTEAILHSGGLDVDMDLAFASAMVKQYDAILKGRGARSRMIARSGATGINVSQGYEKDPVIAITQAMQAAAGSQAKAIIAKEGAAAIAGRDIKWQDYQKDNMSAVAELEAELDKLSLNSPEGKERKKELDQQLLSVRQEIKKVLDPSPDYIIKKQRQVKKILDEMKGLVRWSDIDKAKKLKAQIAIARQGVYSDYLKLVETRKLDAKTQPNAFKEATGAMEDILRNQEFADRILGTVKGLAVWQYLGFRVSSAAVNVTNMVTGVPAAINGETDNKVTIGKSISHVGKAMKNFTLHRAGKLSGEQKDVFDEIQEKGWDNPVFNREAFDVLSTKLGKGWNFALEKSMWLFGKTEEFNRASTIAATYFAMKEVNNGAWNHDEMMEKAKDISDKAHGVYSKANRPYQMRGGNLAGRILQASYVFQTFIHNYIQEMLRLGFDKNQTKAALYMAFSPALFGIGATIPMGIAKAISNVFGGDDPEEELIQLAEDSFGAGDIARNGIMGFGGYGVNLRGSLATRFGVPSTFADIFGAPGSVVSDIWEGGKNITKGYYQEGFEKLAPAAFGNISRGLRESKQGATTRSGAPIFWGKKQIKSDPIETVLRMLSFNPTGISKKKEIQWNEYKIQSRYRDKKSEIYKKLKRFYNNNKTQRSRADLIKIKADIRDFNSEVRRKGLTRFVPIITNRSIRSIIRRLKRPPKRERLRKGILL